MQIVHNETIVGGNSLWNRLVNWIGFGQSKTKSTIVKVVGAVAVAAGLLTPTIGLTVAGSFIIKTGIVLASTKTAHVLLLNASTSAEINRLKSLIIDDVVLLTIITGMAFLIPSPILFILVLPLSLKGLEYVRSN